MYIKLNLNILYLTNQIFMINKKIKVYAYDLSLKKSSAKLKSFKKEG
jgi:hypothetical protein